MADYSLTGGYWLRDGSPYQNPNQSTDIDNKTLTTVAGLIDGVTAIGKTLVRPVTPFQEDAQAHAAEDAAWLLQWWRDHMTDVVERTTDSNGGGTISGTYNGQTLWVRASARTDPFNIPTTQWEGMGFCATGPSSNAMTAAWQQLYDDVLPKTLN